MKRVMIVSVSIELSAERPSGIDAAAMEALAQLRCDFAMDCRDSGAFGAKIVSKSIDRHDEDRLFDLVLETTGLTEKQFMTSKAWSASQARHLFAYYARKYLEWDWDRISFVVRRNQNTIAGGVQRMVGLISGNGTGDKDDEQRAVRILEDMARIQEKWAEAKQ